jgi:hypothetical protein
MAGNIKDGKLPMQDADLEITEAKPLKVVFAAAIATMSLPKPAVGFDTCKSLDELKNICLTWGELSVDAEDFKCAKVEFGKMVSETRDLAKAAAAASQDVKSRKKAKEQRLDSKTKKDAADLVKAEKKAAAVVKKGHDAEAKKSAAEKATAVKQEVRESAGAVCGNRIGILKGAPIPMPWSSVWGPSHFPGGFPYKGHALFYGEPPMGWDGPQLGGQGISICLHFGIPEGRRIKSSSWTW